MLAPFLTDVVGYSDIRLATSAVCLPPPLCRSVGSLRAIAWAIAGPCFALFLLTLGYGGIGLLPKKLMGAFLSMLFIMGGGALGSSLAPSRAARMKPVRLGRHSACGQTRLVVGRHAASV